MTLAPQRRVRDVSLVFAAVRELYSRLPERRTLAPYELQGTLWLLHYTNELAPEAEIAAACGGDSWRLGPRGRGGVSKEKRRRAVAALVRRGGTAIPVSAGEEMARERRGFYIEWHMEE